MTVDVRVLSCRRALAADQRAALQGLLADDELLRRDRFVHDADRDRFLIGRAVVRREVAHLRGISPAAVRFELGEFGKPSVVGGPHVNVSHSGDVVLIAMCEDAEVGIDVEQVDARHTDRPTIEHSFSDAEIVAFDRLPPELQVEAFFHIWSSREAIMKVTGLGFSTPREAFDVSVDPREPPRLLHARPPIPSALALFEIDAPPEHAAVLAVADLRPVRIRVEYS